jgi:GLPGLI family protein
MIYEKNYADESGKVDMNRININGLMKELSGKGLRGWVSYSIMKKYPEGKNTVSDRMGFDYYQYEESYEPQQWKLAKDTATVHLNFADYPG